MVTASDTRPPVRLHGTPVVPGVVLAPVAAGARRGVARPRSRRSARRTRRRGRGAGGVRRSGRGRGRRVHRQGGPRERRGRRGAHGERRAGPRQGAALGGAQAARRGGDDLLAPCRRPSTSSSASSPQMGGLMAERVTDLRDIERRLVARLVGEPEPGVRDARRALACSSPRTSRRPTPPGLDPALVRGPGDRERRPHQPHRDHRPPARHPVRGRRRRRARGWRPAPACWSTARPGRSRSTRTRTRPRRRVDEDRAARAALRLVDRARPTADGVPVKLLANVADGDSARAAAGAPVEGVGLFRTELCFLDRSDEPTVEEQAQVYAEVLRRVRRRRPVRRRPHARRGLRQADRVRDPRPARRTPRSASAACGCPSATPACSSGSSTAIAPRPARPAPRPG